VVDREYRSAPLFERVTVGMTTVSKRASGPETGPRLGEVRFHAADERFGLLGRNAQRAREKFTGLISRRRPSSAAQTFVAVELTRK